MRHMNEEIVQEPADIIAAKVAVGSLPGSIGMNRKGRRYTHFTSTMFLLFWKITPP
jgi:hypothetical protein